MKVCSPMGNVKSWDFLLLNKHREFEINRMPYPTQPY